MVCDVAEHAAVDVFSSMSVCIPQRGRIGQDGLDGSGEADAVWRSVRVFCGLVHERPGEVVCKDGRGDFGANGLGGLAAEDVHLKCGLEGSDPRFDAPSPPVEFDDALSCVPVGIEQRGNEPDLSAFAFVIEHDADQPDAEPLWQRGIVVCFSQLGRQVERNEPLVLADGFPVGDELPRVAPCGCRTNRSTCPV